MRIVCTNMSIIARLWEVLKTSGVSCNRDIYKNHFYCSLTESEQTQLLFMPVVFSWDINKHHNNYGSTMECKMFVGRNFSVIRGFGGLVSHTPHHKSSP